MKEHIKKHKVKYIIPAVLLIVAAFCIVQFTIPYIRRHYSGVSVDEAAATTGEKVDLAGKKILTVYFTRVGNTDFESDVDAVSSASLMKEGERLIGNSELLAKMVKDSVGGDLYAITTEKKYPSSYGDTVSESAEENKNEEPLALSGEMPEVGKYDTIIAVYPVWWGSVPKAVNSFFKKVDFSGKTIYVIGTHGGSGLASSVEDLQKITTGTVKEPALSVYDDDVTEAMPQVTEWLKGLAG